jgi:hypothetical protein
VKKVVFLLILILVLLIISLVFISPVLAYRIEDLQLPEKGDFVLGPGKIEIWADPGEEFQKELIISNRIGQTMEFNVEIEDIKGSFDPNQPIIFLAEKKGPYSLKDYLQPEITKFTLKHGQRIILPVKISIPKDAEPGGLYGAILVSTNPPFPEGKVEKEKARGQLRMISRLACNFFIRVKGKVVENGYFKDFLTKKFFEKGPIPFQIFFENKGNVHLIPYGIIEIKNLLGKKVGEVEIEPFYTLPNSLKKSVAEWERKWLFGKYTALAGLNRSYQNIIDQKKIEFWVIPYKIILVGLIVLVLIVWLFKWIGSHFEIRRKA